MSGQEKNGNVMESFDDLLNYKIPEELISKIPEEFYLDMLRGLTVLYGKELITDIFKTGREIGVYDLNSGSGAWADVFESACRRHNMDQLLEYYWTLPWYLSDQFDGIIEGEIIEIITRGKKDIP